jgi:hypothetical protein
MRSLRGLFKVTREPTTRDIKELCPWCGVPAYLVMNHELDHDSEALSARCYQCTWEGELGIEPDGERWLK